MALPLNEVPKYTCSLPSTGQTITYRPFLVKEQKIMLTAIESENDDEKDENKKNDNLEEKNLKTILRKRNSLKELRK